MILFVCFAIFSWKFLLFKEWSKYFLVVFSGIRYRPGQLEYSNQAIMISDGDIVSLSRIEQNLLCLSKSWEDWRIVMLYHFGHFLLWLDEVIDVERSWVWYRGKNSWSERRPFNWIEIFTKVWFKWSHSFLLLNIIQPNRPISRTSQEKTFVKWWDGNACNWSEMRIKVWALLSVEWSVNVLDWWFSTEDVIDIDISWVWLSKHILINNVFDLLSVSMMVAVA